MSESFAQIISGITSRLERWRGLNEAQTCQVIVLRILQALGWDIWDPYEVTAQDTGMKGYRPDYLLNIEKSPVLVIEVKALDKTPDDSDRTQVVNYANSQNIRWAVLTTGRLWEFFDNKVDAKAPEKRVLLFSLDGPSSSTYLERLLTKSFWSTKKAPQTLARIVEDIRKEIETQQSLTKIEERLRNALEEGYERSERGLRKAIEKELSANEQELALANLDLLLSRIFGPKSSPERPGSLIQVLQSFGKRLPNATDAGIRVITDQGALVFSSWRNLYHAIIEAVIQLNREDILEELHRSKDIVSSLLQRRKAGGEPYKPSAYLSLSTGEYLFVHKSADQIRKKIRNILILLETPPSFLRIEHHGDSYLLP